MILRASNWRIKNPEKRKIITKKWRENNPEKDKEIHKKWKLRNKDYHKQWYEINKEKIKTYMEQYRSKNYEKMKAYREKNKDILAEKRHKRYYANIKLSRKKANDWNKKNPYRNYKKYGVDIPLLVKKQNNKCAICKKEKKLYVDHCHKKLIIRGLLCHQCNVALGLFYDSTENLNNALTYLNASTITKTA